MKAHYMPRLTSSYSDRYLKMTIVCLSMALYWEIEANPEFSMDTREKLLQENIDYASEYAEGIL